MTNQIILQPEKYRQWQRFHNGAAGTAEGWQEAVYTQPIQKATRESDILVPFAQAAISGAFAFFCILLSIRLAAFYWDIPGGVWEYLTGAALLGALVSWAKWRGLLDDTRSLLRRVETYINQDIDGDGVIGEPVETIRLETFDRDHEGKLRAGQFATLPISEHQLILFARQVDSGARGLSQSDWTGADGLLTKKQHTQLMEYFERAGIVRWKNDKAPAQGRELTMAGVAAIANIAKHARTQHARTQP